MITEKIDRYLTEEKKIPGYKEQPGGCGDCYFSHIKDNGGKGSRWVLICGNYNNVRDIFGKEKDPIYYTGILGTTPDELVVDRHGYCPRYHFDVLLSKKMGYHRYEEGK